MDPHMEPTCRDLQHMGDVLPQVTPKIGVMGVAAAASWTPLQGMTVPGCDGGFAVAARFRV